MEYGVFSSTFINADFWGRLADGRERRWSRWLFGWTQMVGYVLLTEAKGKRGKAQVLTHTAQSTYLLKTIIQQFQMLFEQEKSKGQRDFSPAAKNETNCEDTISSAFPALDLEFPV